MTVKQGSQFVEILGSKIHYIDEGEGEALVFIHGMPTSSYLWRHIIDQLKGDYRCIALDLVGMGASDKPDIDYRIFDHIKYFDAFIEALDLKDITLVMHGWGSLVGFDYAKRHENNVKAMAFYESHVRAAIDWDMLSLPVQQLASMLQSPASYSAIVEHDYLVEKLVPSGAINQLPHDVIEKYREPFPDATSRKPLWQYVQDLPLGEGSTDVVDLINGYSAWLQETPIPKLLMYAIPGFITTIDTVLWSRDNICELELVELGEAMHFAQETMPEVFSEALSNWLSKLDQ
ncbi:MAG: haloalkane dehalogenase [Coxiellaceae bacterium]|nr:haloalkane dehalogenase [Coxiellaceae bacterium]